MLSWTLTQIHLDLLWLGTHLPDADALFSTLASALLLGRLKRTPGWWALLSFPGTFAHELCHFVVGWCLAAKPTAIQLWPERHGNTWTLGSVTFARLRPWNAAPVALAPLLLLPLTWLILTGPLTSAWRALNPWAILGWSYLAGLGMYACWPSPTDLRWAGWSLLWWGILAWIGLWAGQYIS